MFKTILLTGSLLFGAISHAEVEQIPYWQDKTVQMSLNGKSNAVFESNVIFNQILKTISTYDCSYYTEPQYYTTVGTCYELECSGGASGQSKAWNEFYSAKKEKKAAKLADAIKGIGEGTAGKIVEKGIFNSKPKTWNDFKSSIKKATQMNLISQEQERMILSTYREDNMDNLGYSKNSCKSTPYSCQEVIITSPSVFIPKTCQNVDEQVINNKAVLYKIQIQNAELLADESESLNLRVSVDPNKINLESSYYNQYQVQLDNYNGQTASISINGVGRKQVNMPSNYLSNVTISGDYSHADLDVLVQNNALPMNNQEKLNIRYKVKSCKIGFFGTCGIGWDKEQTYTSVLDKNNTRINLPILQPNEKRGVKMEVDVEVFKTSSKYFNSSALKKVSNKITLK